jgi:hypothetical protein
MPISAQLKGLCDDFLQIFYQIFLFANILQCIPHQLSIRLGEFLPPGQWGYKSRSHLGINRIQGTDLLLQKLIAAAICTMEINLD